MTQYKYYDAENRDFHFTGPDEPGSFTNHGPEMSGVTGTIVPNACDAIISKAKTRIVITIRDSQLVFLLSVANLISFIYSCKSRVLTYKSLVNNTSMTFSSRGGPSSGPSRIQRIQWNLCLMPPPMPFATTRPENEIKRLSKISCE